MANNFWGSSGRIVRRCSIAALVGVVAPASLVLATSSAAPSPAGAVSDHARLTYPADYAIFAAAAVRHYAPMGVHTWEIWNEPNIPEFWSPAANVVQYAAMLKQADVAIKAADPTATVLTGGTS